MINRRRKLLFGKNALSWCDTQSLFWDVIWVKVGSWGNFLMDRVDLVLKLESVIVLLHCFLKITCTGLFTSNDPLPPPHQARIDCTDRHGPSSLINCLIDRIICSDEIANDFVCLAKLLFQFLFLSASPTGRFLNLLLGHACLAHYLLLHLLGLFCLK